MNEILSRMDSVDWAAVVGLVGACFTFFTLMLGGWRSRARALQTEIDELKKGFLKRDQMIAEMNCFITLHHKFINEYQIHVLGKPAPPAETIEKYFNNLRKTFINGKVYLEIGDGQFLDFAEMLRRAEKSAAMEFQLPKSFFGEPNRAGAPESPPAPKPKRQRKPRQPKIRKTITEILNDE